MTNDDTPSNANRALAPRDCDEIERGRALVRALERGVDALDTGRAAAEAGPIAGAYVVSVFDPYTADTTVIGPFGDPLAALAFANRHIDALMTEAHPEPVRCSVHALRSVMNAAATGTQTGVGDGA